MRWRNPEHGDQRIVTRFLLLPHTIDGETRWFERARVVERYAVRRNPLGEYGQWYEVAWADAPPKPKAKPPATPISRIAVALLAALLLTGCVSLSVPLPDGRVARYTRIGSTSLDGLKVRHGDTEIEVQGYQSEGATMLEGAMRGFGQGLRSGGLP